MAEHDFMVPGHPSIVLVREDGMIDLHDPASKLTGLDTEMNPLGEGGGQVQHPGKPKQSSKMDYLG